ncbi:hypothetical protein Dsin_029908 [Dipteronia sinensis]|uniref:Uncharacterized protein n=1 Tax=Dipteronia sinensis TaxID=43782 RepID=A0AAE0DX56_9ROSI|nr:hypothetical protein Dsin_029908 [Dipteronia sinensis]
MASGVHPDHNVFPSVLKSSTLLVDLRVDELKVYTEKECVGMAMKEAFQHVKTSDLQEHIAVLYPETVLYVEVTVTQKRTEGDCKHTIMIRDMRLIHPEDLHNQAELQR